MGRTMTLEEARDRTVYDLVQEAAHGHGPLIISLEDGSTVSVQGHQGEEQPGAEAPTLEPLPKLAVSVPANWKDMVYGEDGSGTP
jgi:hypothetical protein